MVTEIVAKNRIWVLAKGKRIRIPFLKHWALTGKEKCTRREQRQRKHRNEACEKGANTKLVTPKKRRKGGGPNDEETKNPVQKWRSSGEEQTFLHTEESGGIVAPFKWARVGRSMR